MPILHIQLSGEGQTPNGKSIVIPPQTAMMQRGPVVQVMIGVEEITAKQLLVQGTKLPEPISGIALIDTGATSTCIDEAVAKKLGLPTTDVVTIASASHSSARCNVYPAMFEVVGLPIKFNAMRAIGVPLENQGLQVLIGRDLLKHSTLFYNGMVGTFTLSI